MASGISARKKAHSFRVYRGDLGRELLDDRIHFFAADGSGRRMDIFCRVLIRFLRRYHHVVVCDGKIPQRGYFYKIAKSLICEPCVMISDGS